MRKGQVAGTNARYYRGILEQPLMPFAVSDGAGDPGHFGCRQSDDTVACQAAYIVRNRRGRENRSDSI